MHGLNDKIFQQVFVMQCTKAYCTGEMLGALSSWTVCCKR